MREVVLASKALWLVFVWDDRIHLPRPPSPGLPPPSLPWFTQMDFNTGGAGAGRLPGDSPPSGQTGSALTPSSGHCGQETHRLPEGWHIGQPPSWGSDW